MSINPQTRRSTSRKNSQKKTDDLEIEEWFELNRAGWRRHLRELDHLGDPYAAWGPAEEASLIYVLEAQRRFMEEVNDSRAAAAMTLAWATLQASARA